VLWRFRIPQSVRVVGSRSKREVVFIFIATDVIKRFHERLGLDVGRLQDAILVLMKKLNKRRQSLGGRGTV